MTDIVKGMANAYGDKILSDPDATIEDGMRAALMWLADHYENTTWSTSVKLPGGQTVESFKLVAAAIRAAAGEEGK